MIQNKSIAYKCFNEFSPLAPDALRTPSSRLASATMDDSGQYLLNMLARLNKDDEFILTDICTDLSNLIPRIVKVEVEEDEAKDQYLVDKMRRKKSEWFLEK